MDGTKNQRCDYCSGPEANSRRKREQQVSSIEKFLLQPDKGKGKGPQRSISRNACGVQSQRLEGKAAKRPNEHNDQSFGRKPPKYSLPVIFAEEVPGLQSVVAKGPLAPPCMLTFTAALSAGKSLATNCTRNTSGNVSAMNIKKSPSRANAVWADEYEAQWAHRPDGRNFIKMVSGLANACLHRLSADYTANGF